MNDGKFRQIMLQAHVGLTDEEDSLIQIQWCPLPVAEKISSESSIRSNPDYKIIDGFWPRTIRLMTENPLDLEAENKHKVEYLYSNYGGSMKSKALHKSSDDKVVIKLDDKFLVNLIESQIKVKSSDRDTIRTKESPFPDELGKKFLEDKFGSIRNAISWSKKKRMVEGLN